MSAELRGASNDRIHCPVVFAAAQATPELVRMMCHNAIDAALELAATRPNYLTTPRRFVIEFMPVGEDE